MDVGALVERLWPDRLAAIERLGGGITNHNFRVAVGAEVYVVRIGGRDTSLLGIDRDGEHEASLLAAELGIGPEVVAWVDGCLVTRFLPGEVGRPDPAEAGALLRRLHAGGRLRGSFDPFRTIEAYAATALGRGVAPPPVHEPARELAERIEAWRVRCRPQPRPCHNDLLPANFVRDRERLWIVDWEYAGMGDPVFDLANLAAAHRLDEEGERALLAAYGEPHLAGLVLMRFVSDLREAMWGVVQQAISELDFDFRGYAAEHFERLERTAAEPRFRRALAQA